MSVPRWCTIQLWSLIFCLITFGFLLVAIATPWYNIAITDLPPPDSKVIATFWWKGLYEVITHRGSNDVYTDIISWDSLESRRPKDIYMVSMALSIIDLVAILVVAVGLLFGLVFIWSRRILDRIFCGCVKWYLIVVSSFILVLAVLAWTVYFGFPEALKASNLCPGDLHFPDNDHNPKTTGDLWCKSFSGTKKVIFTNSTSGETWEAKYMWGPSIGWIFSIIASLWSGAIVIATLFVRRDIDYESLDSHR